MLQAKRFQAQLSGTTYAYDLPDMFRRMAEKHWREFSIASDNQTIIIPKDILVEHTELVLKDNKLEEIIRQPGSNNVRNIFLPPSIKKLTLLNVLVRYYCLENMFTYPGVPSGS